MRKKKLNLFEMLEKLSSEDCLSRYYEIFQKCNEIQQAHNEMKEERYQIKVDNKTELLK